MGEFLKRALIRQPDGSLIIECCGNKVPQAMPPIIAGTVCSTCGNVYDVRGWIIDNTNNPKGKVS